MPSNYSVEYYNGASYVALTGVQNLDLRWGRQKITDTWSATTGSVVIKAPNYFASPITQLVPGVAIRITNVTAAQQICILYLSDIKVDYGIPYASSIGNADFITLTLEGAFARFARIQGNGYSMAAGTMTAQLSAASTQANITLGVDSSNSPNSQVATTTVDGSWADWLNTFLVTNGARMQDYNVNPNISFKYAIGTGLNFSDTTNDSTNKAYYALNFGSLADNFYTQVTVDGNTLSPVTVQSGSSPYRSLNLKTFSSSTSEATDLANYYLASLNTSKVQAVSVSMMNEKQNVKNLDFNFFGRTQLRSNLTFRGTTQSVLVIGGTLSATPDRMMMTCYLSGFENNNFLTLNDSVFGRLDYNKLGF